MTQSMRGDMLSDTSEPRVAGNHTFDRAGADTAKITRGTNIALVAAIIKKQGGKGIGAGVEIILNTLGRRRRDKYRAVFVAFTTDHKLATFEVDRIAI